MIIKFQIRHIIDLFIWNGLCYFLPTSACPIYQPSILLYFCSIMHFNVNACLYKSVIAYQSQYQSA